MHDDKEGRNGSRARDGWDVLQQHSHGWFGNWDREAAVPSSHWQEPEWPLLSTRIILASNPFSK